MVEKLAVAPFRRIEGRRNHRLRHPPAEQSAGAQISGGAAWAGRGGEERLVRAVDRARLRGAGGACCRTGRALPVRRRFELADICLVPQMYNVRRFNVPLSDYPLLVRADEEGAECIRTRSRPEGELRPILHRERKAFEADGAPATLHYQDEVRGSGLWVELELPIE